MNTARLALLALLLATPAALAGVTIEGDDNIRSGDNVEARGAVDDDLILAGGDVDVDATVQQDVIVVGGDVRVAGIVKEDVFAAGGEVVIAAEIGRKLRVAGGDVAIEKTAHVVGNARVAGGDVKISGAIDGDLHVAGGSVVLDGAVGGDVHAVGGDLTLGPNARINGRLTYRIKEDFEQDPAAVVTGGIEREQWKERRFLHSEGAWVWTLGIAATAILMLLLAPGFAGRVTDTIHDRFGFSMLIGFAALVCIPFLAVVAAITVIGLPVAVIVLFAYPVLMLLGYVFAVIALGDIGLHRFRPLKETDRGARMLAAVVVIGLAALLSRVPVIGALITLAVLTLGIGALLRQLWSNRSAAA